MHILLLTSHMFYVILKPMNWVNTKIQENTAIVKPLSREITEAFGRAA